MSEEPIAILATMLFAAKEPVVPAELRDKQHNPLLRNANSAEPAASLSFDAGFYTSRATAASRAWLAGAAKIPLIAISDHKSARVKVGISSKANTTTGA